MYEDKIILNEVKKNISKLIKDAQKDNINVKTEYFTPEQRKEAELQLGKDAPETFKQAYWHAKIGQIEPDPAPYQFREINIPQTPSLLNYLIASEEYEHAKNPNIHTPRTGPYYWYDEERRAKPLAKKRVGGVDKETEEIFDKGMKSYQDSLAYQVTQDDAWVRSPMTGNTPKAMAWKSFGITPIQYALSKYPEMRNHPFIIEYLEQGPMTFEKLIEESK